MRMILAGLGRFGLFCGQVTWRMLTPPWDVGEVCRYIWLLTVRCVLPVVAVVFPCGMVVALQALTIFDLFGAQRLLSSLVSFGMLREMSPVLASVLVTAQGGSSFAAELGSMRIKEEIDATEVMAVDSLRVHVVPRVMAAIVATPILNLAGTLSGIFGGFVTAVWLKGEPSGTYWGNVWELVGPFDVIGGTLKTIVFGAIIGYIACYQGYNAQGGAAAVGKAVNNTVVYSGLTFITTNYFLTSALFGALG